MKIKDNKNCYACGKKQLSKNEIGLNKKLLGRTVKQYFCLDCLASYLEVTAEELLDKVEDFKTQGCMLFE